MNATEHVVSAGIDFVEKTNQTVIKVIKNPITSKVATQEQEPEVGDDAKN